MVLEILAYFGYAVKQLLRMLFIVRVLIGSLPTEVYGEIQHRCLNNIAELEFSTEMKTALKVKISFPWFCEAGQKEKRGKDGGHVKKPNDSATNLTY